jgi:segregation and condensation protein B
VSTPALETLLEATLFGAGRSMTAEELSECLEVTNDEINDSIESLQSTLKRRRGGALCLSEVGDRWAIEVKPNLADHLPQIAKPTVSDALLKTLSLIAYHQPMSQSRLVELIGQKAYDHVRALSQLGLIDKRRDGNTRRLGTTRRFSEMFSCPHVERKKVRKWWREQVDAAGLTSGPSRPEALMPEQGQLVLPLEEESEKSSAD